MWKLDVECKEQLHSLEKWVRHLAVLFITQQASLTTAEQGLSSRLSQTDKP